MLGLSPMVQSNAYLDRLIHPALWQWQAADVTT
jgi:hypothetical protein